MEATAIMDIGLVFLTLPVAGCALAFLTDITVWVPDYLHQGYALFSVFLGWMALMTVAVAMVLKVRNLDAETLRNHFNGKAANGS